MWLLNQLRLPALHTDLHENQRIVWYSVCILCVHWRLVNGGEGEYKTNINFHLEHCWSLFVTEISKTSVVGFEHLRVYLIRSRQIQKICWSVTKRIDSSCSVRCHALHDCQQTWSFQQSSSSKCASAKLRSIQHVCKCKECYHPRPVA